MNLTIKISWGKWTWEPAYLHAGSPCRHSRRGGRPAAAEEPLPDEVGVAGAAPGPRAPAEGAHVRLLRTVRARQSTSEPHATPTSIYRNRRRTWRRHAMATAMSSGRSAHLPAGAGDGESSISQFPSGLSASLRSCSCRGRGGGAVGFGSSAAARST
jgi:hypothetical protein